MSSLTLFALLAKQKADKPEPENLAEDLDTATRTPVADDDDDATLLTTSQSPSIIKQLPVREKKPQKRDQEVREKKPQKRDQDYSKEVSKTSQGSKQCEKGTNKLLKADDRYEEWGGATRNGKHREPQGLDERGSRRFNDKEWQDSKGPRNAKDKERGYYSDNVRDSRSKNGKGHWDDWSQGRSEPDNRSSNQTTSKFHDWKDKKQQDGPGTQFKVTIDETGWQAWTPEGKDAGWQDWSGKDRDKLAKGAKADGKEWQDWSNNDRDRQKSTHDRDRQLFNNDRDRQQFNHDRDRQQSNKSNHDRNRQNGPTQITKDMIMKAHPEKANGQSTKVHDNEKDQKKKQPPGKAAGKNGSMEGLKGLKKGGGKGDGKGDGKNAEDDDDEDNPGPEENRRVFFNHVPWRTPEEDLRELFDPCGKIVSFELWLREDGRSLGMGCVVFSTARGADTAVDKLRRRYVRGRTMYVSKKKPSAQQVAAEVKKTCSLMEEAGIPASAPKPNENLTELLQNFPIDPSESSDDEFIDEDVNFDEPDPRRVFFSNLSFKTSEGFLRSQFEDAGHVISFELWRQGNGKSLGKGCAEFDNVAAAQNCIKLYDGKPIDGRPISVVPDPRPRGNPKARVFFHNVSWTCTEKTLKTKFEQFGSLKAFELRVKWDGRALGMGCCEYQSAADAACAIRWLNGTEIEGRTVYVSEFNRSGA